MRPSVWLILLCINAIWAVPPEAHAQAYPNRPLRFVIPFPPGGGADTLARVLAHNVARDLGQQIVIDNRGGAAGNIAAEVAAKANPDGYTLLQGNISHTISRTLYHKLNYDLIRDFAPVTRLASVPFMLLVNPSFPAHSIKELIALARSQPGELDYASSGSGGPSHMAMELLKSTADLKIRHIPYKGAGPAGTDLIGGRVQMMFFTLPAALPHIRSGRLKALAIASAQRIPQAKEVPTFDESGVRGFEATTWFGVLVPSGTPRPVINRLYKTFVSALAAPEVHARLVGQGFQVGGSTPEEFRQFIGAEIAKWARVIKASGITIN